MKAKQTPTTYTKIKKYSILFAGFITVLFSFAPIPIEQAEAASEADCAVGWNSQTAEVRIDKNEVHLDEQFFVYARIVYDDPNLRGICDKAPVNFQLSYSTSQNRSQQQQLAKTMPVSIKENNVFIGYHYKFPLSASSLLGKVISRENLEFSVKVLSESGSLGVLPLKQRVAVDSSKAAPNPVTDNLPTTADLSLAEARNGQVLSESVDTQCIVCAIGLWAAWKGFAPEKLLFGFLAKVTTLISLLYQMVVILLFLTLIVPMLAALLAVQAYTDEFVGVIYPGWVILRNLANIAFIVSLLAMGLRILFQQEDSGKTRGFIINLVIMALLVNFSLVIAQSVVAVADTVQAQFLPKESYVIQTIGMKLMFDPAKCLNDVMGSSCQLKATNVTADAADIFKPIIQLWTAIAALIAFIAIAAFVLVRLVALWFLYMLSPVAYFAAVLPQTAKFSAMWWEQFIKNAITVPILAFFLNMAALMSDQFSVVKGNVPVFRAGDFPKGSEEFVNFALTIITHFIVIAFLFMGMYFAKQSGAAGSQKIVGAAQKGLQNLAINWPKKFGSALKDDVGYRTTKRLSDAGYEKSATAAAALFNPMKTGKEALNKMKEERADTRKYMADKFGNIPKLTARPAKGNILKQYDDEKKEKLGDLSDGEVNTRFRESIEKRNKKLAGASLAHKIEKGDFDGFRRSVSGALKTGPYSNDAAGNLAALNDLQKHLGFSDAEMEKFKIRINNKSADKADLRHNGNLGNYDEETGKWNWRKLNAEGKFEDDDKWHDEIAEARTKKHSLVNDFESSHVDSMVSVDKDGNYSFTKNQIKRLNDTDIDQIKNTKNIEKFHSGKVEDDKRKSLQKAFEGMTAEQRNTTFGGKERVDAIQRFLYNNPERGKEKEKTKPEKDTKEKPEKEEESVIVDAKGEPYKKSSAKDPRKTDTKSGKTTTATGDRTTGGTSGADSGAPTASAVSKSVFITPTTIKDSPFKDRFEAYLGKSGSSTSSSSGGVTMGSAETIVERRTEGDTRGASKPRNSENFDESRTITGFVNTNNKGMDIRNSASILKNSGVSAATSTSSSSKTSVPSQNAPKPVNVVNNVSAPSSTTSYSPTDDGKQLPSEVISQAVNFGNQVPVNGRSEQKGKAEAKPGDSPKPQTASGKTKNPSGKTVGSSTTNTSVSSGGKSEPAPPMGPVLSTDKASRVVMKLVQVDGQNPKEYVKPKELVSFDKNGNLPAETGEGGNLQVRLRGNATELVPNFDTIASEQDYKQLENAYIMPPMDQSKPQKITVQKPATVVKDKGKYIVTKGILRLADK